MKKGLFLLCTVAVLLFASNRCEEKLFNIKSNSGISIKEYVDNLADECDLTVLIKDKYAQKKLHKRLQKISVQNMTLRELLNLLLTENDLNYKLQNNLLKISYLITKTFHVDYVTTKRTGETVTDASVDVGSSTTTTSTTTTIGTTSASSSGSGDVNKITSKDEFDFWKDIEKEIHDILNRPEDEYKAPDPVININAGLITVTATKNQIERVEKYLKKIELRLHKEVLIDVSILAVILNDKFTNGIDWSRFSLTVNGGYDTDGKFTPSGESLLRYRRDGSGTSTANFDVTRNITSVLDASVNLAGIINFLEQNGKVITLSNPKLLTLNNQPAIISIGDTINYNVPTQILLTQNGGTGTQSYTPSSVFIGILLNITPEITDDGQVILRINPSISEPRDPKQLDQVANNGIRQIAPDISEKKISSVVKVKSGSTLILGGLISNIKNFTINGVPVLRDVPLLGALFRSQSRNNQRFELVFIIKPRIISSETSDEFGLKDLGYSLVNDAKK